MEFVIENIDKLDFSQPLSFKTIRNRTRINGKLPNKKLLLATLNIFEKYKIVEPLDVGCGKYKVNVWTRV
jgi:hypothetical protein